MTIIRGRRSGAITILPLRFCEDFRLSVSVTESRNDIAWLTSMDPVTVYCDLSEGCNSMDCFSPPMMGISSIRPYFSGRLLVNSNSTVEPRGSFNVVCFSLLCVVLRLVYGG